MSLRAMAISTMTVARLPKRIDIKKVVKHKIQSSLRWRFVVIDCEMTPKPPWLSMISMMAIEPSTKKSVVATSPRPRMSLRSTNANASSCFDILCNSGKMESISLTCAGGLMSRYWSALMMNIAQSRIAIPTAVAALLTLMTSSKAIARIPRMKMTGIR